MAEQNNFERGELITPASLELQKFQRDHSQISGAPLTGDILRVSGTTAGPPNRQPANMTNEERALARINGTAMTAYKPDANRFNKITTYNATHHGRNFERYYANTAGFKKLGFSPFRDNEALYNKNTSLWDDAQRGIVAAAKLYGGAFGGAVKNWSNPFSLEPNAEEADEMERLMSIGSSSRGGFGGTAINFGVNLSYGMGVMSEVLAEEAAIVGIVALTGLETGGATAALGAARTGMNLKKLANAFSLGRAAKSFSNTFRAATKITEARQLWGVAKGLGKTVDNLLPFEQTRSLLTASGKTAAKWNSLDNMAKTTKAFGSFYRDLREINAVTYESKLEGGSVQNDVITQMMSEFRKKNGRDPNDQEAKAMYGEGHKAGYLASQLNAVGIYISNKIVLNKALKGIPGLAQADDVARRTMKGTLIQNTNWAKKGINPWEVARGIKKYGKAAFYKQTFNPKNLAKGGLGYLSANLMEGAQEVYQEAVANGVTSYYMGAFNNPSRVGGAEFQAKMLGGLKSQMSGQGMETFLSGFLMAGPMTAAQSAFFGAVDLGRKGKLKIQDRQFKADPANAGKASPFEQQLNAEKDYDNKVVDALNDITKDPKKYFSAIEQNARTQVDLERLGEQAAADGDMHAAKNIKDESLTNHIITLLESGHFEIFQDQLKGLKDLETSELQEAFDEPGDAKKTVSQRIDTVLKRTEQIKATHEKYQAKVNPFSMREDPLSYMAFEQARNIAIRNDVTYQRTGERMTDILNQFNSDMPFSNANATDFTNLFVVGGMTEGGFDRIGLNSEVQLLDGQIQNLSDSIPEQKAQKDKLIQKRDDLKSLSGTIQAYASAYKVTQSAAQTEAEHAINMDTFIETEKVFKKAYADYVQNLAKGSGQTILNSAVDSSFDKLSDFWKLNVDREDVANAVNMMQNPDMYRVATERLRESMAIAFERRQESLKEALADYKKKHLVNGFLNDLFEKYNAFVEPEEAEAYLNKDTIPETFYDADTLEEIEPGSAKYRGIMALIDQYDEIYFEETGERLIRTDELSNAERRTGYDVTTNKAVAQEFRPRDAKDKRSIKAIADEFGFNHIDTESSVDALEVLKAIAKSKHGYVPRAQKKLAQALLGFIKPGTQIRFKNGHRTNSTYDATNGIIVDANFSAEGFENANIPIEFSILNAAMQQVASESLSDAAFNDRITSVREQFEEALSDLDKKYFKYALTNNQQFIAEAMTNADLQAEMGKIGYEGELTEQTAEAKSVWESFMDSIYELLEKIFGVTRGKTLYQEAMNVITNKLSQPGVAGPSSVPSVLAENETEEEIDIEEEDDPELEQRLRAKFNEVVAAMSPADKVGMNFESWKQSDSMAVSIRNKYSAEKIKKATAAPSSPTVMTEAEQVRRLTSLGYQISEINNMKKGGQQDEIDSIIKNDTKKKIQIRTVDANGKTVYIEADYDQPIAARPNVAAAIKKALQTLDDANVDLNAAETMYNQRVQTGIDPTTGEPVYKKKDGTPDYERLSHVVKDKFEGTNKESTDRGNIIDLLLRDFLNGDILDIRQFNSAYSKYQSKNNSAAFSQEMLNDLFDKFRSVQILLKSNGLTVISNLPGLFGKIGKKHTAGKIDLIAYDAAGKIYIIDLKTSTQDRRAQYKAETDLENAFGIKYSEIKEAIKGGKDRKKTISETLASTRISAEDKEKLKKVAEANPTVDAMFFYKDQDAKQQNGYRELLRQSTGLVADVLSIFPLVTTKAGKIFTKVEFQKEGKDHSMKVDIYDIHDKLGLVNEATYPENPIDKTATAATTTTVPTTTTESTTTTENQIADIARRKQENDVKYAEMQARQKKELEDLNKKEGKNYRDAFDILNVNEYSEDQSQRSQEAIDLANRHEKEFEQLLNEKRGIEDDAAKISYGGRDLSQKQALVAKLKDLLSNIYRTNRNALEEGFMIAPNALAEAEKVGGVNYSAHGMAKTGLAGATEALIDLFTNGINPLKGRGALDTAPLAGGISVGTTAGGNAYMEGPFTLVANKNVQGAITSVDQIAGVVVNEGIATEEVLNTLRELFPDIVFESTSNTSKLVEQLNAKTTTTTTTTSADIIQTNKPNIQTVGNVTFGTANKQGQTENNEDAVYVDAQNGIFILADGMGGEGMLTLSAAQASRLVINNLLGKPEKNLNELLYEEYLKNPDITSDEVLAILQKNGINLTGASVTIPFKIVNAFRTREDLGVRKGFRSGATALKAVRTGKNTYTIEKIGDTVFFVVDKNGNVIQKHGLSDVATTQGYMFSIRDGKPYASTPKTDNFTVTLNEGETLVLSTDFIETDKAVQDFINSDFGKNLDFAKFQKENKTDDSTFITIKYDGKPATTTTTDTEDKQAEINRKIQDAFKAIVSNTKSKNPDNWYSTIDHPDFPELKGKKFSEAYLNEVNGKYYDSLVNYIKAKYNGKIEEQPTKKTTEQTIADLRAREQVDLRKAIPNIDDYPDTYGEKQGNMPGVLYGIYKVIYDKYDKLITDASGTKPKSKGRVKVKAFRTSNTFSSRVGFAQRGVGVYYGLDKPFVELFGESGEVSEVEVEYDPSKTLDALTPEGQAEFMKIKSSAVGNKTFTSIREMNEAVRRAMLTSGYDSLIGYITEDKPADGRELVLYNIVEANQGTDETDKEEMEEVFEEPTPKEEEPAREKTIYEKAFEKSPFQYRPTSSTLGYWDSVEGRIIYFSKKSGEKLLNNNRIRTAARKTFDPNNKKTHPNFKFWWNTLLDDRQRYAIIDGLQDPLWETAGNSDDMYSEEYRIMSRLRGMKFKPTKFNKAEFTDVSDKVWFSDKGANLDLFVMEDLIGDVNNGFPENTDQQDLQNTVIDIIIRYPNGITNYDLRQVLRRDSLQAQLEELMDSFAINYGVDLNSIAPLMDMYRDNLKAAKTIQEINDEEDRKNEGPSSSEEGNGQQSDSTEFLTKEQRRANQDEIDRLTQEYETTVAKRKTYYNSLRQKVGKVSQDRYLNNLKAAEDQELASLKETYEQALEALGMTRSPESQLENISKMNLPESVLNLRESIAKADRVQLSTLEASLKPLSELGIADAVLKQQNLTRDEVNDLIKNARARLKGTLAHAELANTIRLRKPLEERVVYYDTEKGTQAGVLVSFDSEGVSVAPYDGKESLSDLQDESKWVTFTVGEIPYKLFYAKATPAVTATPDIEQQSDALMSEAEIKEAEDTEKLRKTIQDQKFKNQSMDDIENNLYDPLQDCPF